MNATPFVVRTPPRTPATPASDPTPPPAAVAVPRAVAPCAGGLTQALRGLLPPPLVRMMQPVKLDLGDTTADALRSLMESGRSLHVAGTRHKAEATAMAAALSLELPTEWPCCDRVPEIGLLRDPRAFVQQPAAWKALLKVHARPVWLEALLRDEGPQTEPHAIFAQENRLRALARYCLCLRAAQVPSGTAEQLAAVLPSLLALASVESRHRLLTLLVAHSATPWRRDGALRSWREAGAGDARTLALAISLVSPELAARPEVRAVMEARSVVSNGVVARRVLAYILRRELTEAGHDVGHAVLSWANDTNLLRLLRIASSESRTHKAAGTVMTPEGTCADRAAKAAWLETRAADQLRHQVCLALLASRRESEQTCYKDDGLIAVEAERIQLAFAWLATQPGLESAGTLGLELCAALIGEVAQRPPSPTDFSDRLTALHQHRVAARAHKKTLRSDWTQELLTQLEGCVRSWAARNDPAPSSAADRAPRRGSRAAFFALKPVRTYVNQTLVPVVLAMQQYTPLLSALARHGRAIDLHGVSRPQQVVELCVPWFRGPEDAGLRERFLREVKAPENVVAFAARSDTWRKEYRTRALPVLERLLRATLDGTLPALRHESPQMRALRARPEHHASLARWEAGSSQQIPAGDGGGEWRVYDTADLGDTFDAMAQISSCQSPIEGYQSHNVGNLGRLMDGSKRLVVLRDARDKVRGRAILRLMQDPGGTPVLALSTLFITGHSEKARDALAQYAARRGQELGFETLYTSYQSVGASLGEPYACDLTALRAELPDYYDELGGLQEADATLKGSHPMWRLKVSG